MLVTGAAPSGMPCCTFFFKNFQTKHVPNFTAPCLLLHWAGRHVGKQGNACMPVDVPTL